MKYSQSFLPRSALFRLNLQKINLPSLVNLRQEDVRQPRGSRFCTIGSIAYIIHAILKNKQHSYSRALYQKWLDVLPRILLGND